MQKQKLFGNLYFGNILCLRGRHKLIISNGALVESHELDSFYEIHVQYIYKDLENMKVKDYTYTNTHTYTSTCV